jgi:hypothetical protein
MYVVCATVAVSEDVSMYLFNLIRYLSGQNSEFGGYEVLMNDTVKNYLRINLVIVSHIYVTANQS